MNKSYVEELIYGRVESYSEDRLSNIFSATFNNSKFFRKFFLEFIGSKLNYKNLISNTRCTYYNDIEKCIPDIIIFKNDIEKIIIENKIELALTSKQLQSYSKIKEISSAEKLALVKYYFPPDNYQHWKILHWSTLYYEITKKLNKNLKSISDLEQFIIKQFLKHLENLNMDIPEDVKKEEFKLLCKGFRLLKKPITDLPQKSLHFFNIVNIFIKYFEEIVNYTKTDPIFRNKIGKNYQSNPYINHLWYWKSEKDKTKIYFTRFGILITLNKEINQIKKIGIEIIIDNEMKGNGDAIYTFAINSSEYYIEDVGDYYKIKGNKINFNELRDFAINSWKSILNIK